MRFRFPSFLVPSGRLQVAYETGVCDPESSRLLDNDDLRPLRVKDRTWGFWTYLTFWFSAASSVADWYGCSAGVAAGLSPLESLFLSFGGRCVVSLLIAMNGRGGAMYHIPFPALVRSCFGVYGSYWPVISRVILSIVYEGINLVQGGYCFYVMLHAIFPGIANLPNIMPKTAGIDTGVFIGIMILWFVAILVAPMRIPKARATVYIRLATFIVAAVAMLAWCCSLAGGAGKVLSQPATATGTAHKWLVVKFFFVGMSSCATFTTNAADFQRYATKVNDPLIGNLVGGPLANLLVHLVGVIIASSSTTILGKMQWNPILLLDDIMTQNYTPAYRAGGFFIGLCFSYGIIITCNFENILPAANDLAGLVPKYINYKRGAYIITIVALAMNPWYLLSTAAIFVTYISSFGIFLGSIIGVMLTHYFIIARGYINVDALYQGTRTSPYYYVYGFNWRAYMAYFCGVAMCLDGFAGAVGRKVPLAATHYYYVVFPVEIIVASLIYLGLCLKWPVPYQVGLSEKGWKEPKEYYRTDDLEAPTVIEGSSLAGRSDNSSTIKNKEIVELAPRREEVLPLG